MTKQMNELDAIAEEAVMCMSNSTFRSKQIIRAAIDKALEVVLTKEPSEKMLHAATMIAPTWDDNASLAKWRAMTKQLLEELKQEAVCQTQTSSK